MRVCLCLCVCVWKEGEGVCVSGMYVCVCVWKEGEGVCIVCVCACEHRYRCMTFEGPLGVRAVSEGKASPQT